jgi:hypothetical protein
MSKSAQGPPTVRPSKDAEIFEIRPIILGGSPTDPNNKVFLTRQQHIDAVVYWNKLIKELREKQRLVV